MLELELFNLLEGTSDAAFTVTDQGEICSWNKAAERLFGYSATDARTRPVEVFCKDLDLWATRCVAIIAASGIVLRSTLKSPTLICK